jgi:hypothetical protein
LILRKVFQRQGLGLDFGCKLLILLGLACKVLIRDEKERGGDAFPDFGAYFNCSGLGGFFFTWDVADLVRFRCVWGLTCDFWAENEEVYFVT